MNTLIVTAHPSKKGFTHKIASKLKEKRESAGGKVEIIDLYKKEWHMDFLSFQEPKDIEISGVTKKAQELITWADDIVFVAPMWWIDVPAIMKNFIDHVLSAGFAFRFTKKGHEGLLKGKSTQLIMTADAPWYFYKVLPVGRIWKMGRLGFCGLKVRPFKLLSSKRKRSKHLVR